MTNWEQEWQKNLSIFLEKNKTRIESNKTVMVDNRLITRTTIVGEVNNLTWDTDNKTKRIQKCSLNQNQKSMKKG